MMDLFYKQRMNNRSQRNTSPEQYGDFSANRTFAGNTLRGTKPPDTVPPKKAKQHHTAMPSKRGQIRWKIIAIKHS
jgi:hypothetical protein